MYRGLRAARLPPANFQAPRSGCKDLKDSAARALVFGSSARACGGQAVIWLEEFKTRDLVQAGLRETEVTHFDLAACLDHENTGNELKAIGGGHGVGVFIDQQIECDSVLPGEAAGFIGVIFGDAPERQARSLPGLGENLLYVRERELARRTLRLIENKRNGTSRDSVGEVVRPAVCAD
jgi:hypothetical protein